MTQSISASAPASAASSPDEVPTPGKPGTNPAIPVEPEPTMPDPGPDETPPPSEPDEPLGPIETPAPDVGDTWDAPARPDSDGDGIADADEVEQPESTGGMGQAMLS